MRDILVKGLAQLGLSDHALPQLEAYASLLLEKNKVMNLTAITAPQEVATLHLLDSAWLLTAADCRGKTLVDVGTGAGFPGVVAKIFKPELQLTLMEPTGKRVEFLKYVCAQLGLSGVEFAKERAEEAARKVWRAQFDVATARGVAALPMLSEYCLPLVKVGGVFLAMKGPGAAEELAESGAALKKLGGKGSGVAEFHLPGGDVRNIIRIKKISQTPPVYPRNGGKIAKSPLK